MQTLHRILFYVHFSAIWYLLTYIASSIMNELFKVSFVIGNYTQDSKGITDLHASGGSIALSRVASGASDERQCNTTSTRM